MDIEYRKTKRVDLKKWILGRNSKIYLGILVAFLVILTLTFNSLGKIEENNAGEQGQSDVSGEADGADGEGSSGEGDSPASSDSGFVEASLSYKIRINKATHVLTVYKKIQDESYTAVYTFHCAVNADVETGETVIASKQTWVRNNDYSYGHYACLLGNGAYIHSAPYWNQDKTSLSVTSYNNIGKTVTVGSIYLKAADAKWIYENCGISIPVEIYELEDEAPEIGLEEFTTLPGSAYYDPSDK